MKKFSLIVCAVLLLTMMMPLCISASSWKIVENPDFQVPSKTPTLDGNISESEGWSAAGILDTDSMGFFGHVNPLSGSGKMYFASDKENLYFAVTYTDVFYSYTVRYYTPAGEGLYEASYPDPKANTYACEDGKYPTTTPDGKNITCYKTGPNSTSHVGGEWADNEGCFWNIFADSDNADGPANSIVASSGNRTTFTTYGDYWWDGDVFALSLDLCSILHNDGVVQTDGSTPQYCVGVTATGDAKVARTHSSDDKDLSDQCKGKGSVTTDTITFEVAIPWQLIVDDFNAWATTNSFDTTTVDACQAAGAKHWAAVTLHDMYLDKEINDYDEYGRFITVCETLADGVAGPGSSGDNVACMGLKLVMQGNGDTPATQATDTTANNNSGNGQSTTAAGNNSASTTKAAASTTKSASTGASGQGSSSQEASQTFDAGIAVALGALATSGIGIYYSTKKRK